MTFKATIDIMPRPELLDPQGKTVGNNLKNIDITGVSDVRIGKHIIMTLEASSESDAKQKVEKACKDLLANVIMETYQYSIVEM
jgi:phosphoribosylformylglycinamidine synthase